MANLTILKAHEGTLTLFPTPQSPLQKNPKQTKIHI